MLKTREGRTIGSGRIIGIARCAEMLDVHPNTVRNRVADGTLPAPFRKPGSTHWAWFESEIRQVIRDASRA
jgi:predicted DNA-binding transcriptional regulator AlpA